MRYEFWRHQFATKNAHKLKCAQLLRNIRRESRAVTSKIRRIHRKYEPDFVVIELQIIEGQYCLQLWRQAEYTV